MDRILKLKDVMSCTGLSNPSIWRLEKAGKFPKRRKITASRIGWLQSEIDEWIQTRPIAPLKNEE